MSARRIVIMGTGGHASVVIELARTAGYEVVGCVGPQPPIFDAGYCRYLGGDEALISFDRSEVCAAVGIGSVREPSLRKRVYERVAVAGFSLPALTHPRAVTAASAALGPGTQVMANAVVQPLACLGANVIVNTGAVVEHHARIGDHVHVAPGAVVCGGVTIGAGSHVGANATVLQSLLLGEGTVVGAGAVVTRNSASGSVLKGCPAR